MTYYREGLGTNLWYRLLNKHVRNEMRKVTLFLRHYLGNSSQKTKITLNLAKIGAEFINFGQI